MIDFKGTDKPKVLVPAGSHAARLYSIIHVGNVPDSMRESGRRNVIRFTWELPEEMREFNGEQKPMVIGAKYTVSLNEKSNLRPVVETLLGKFEDEDIEGFDIKSLLGKECLISVVHKKSSQGGDYAAVAGVAQLPKGMKVGTAYNSQVYLDYNEGWDDSVYANLPQWLKDEMATSDEMKRKNGFADKETEMDDPSSIPF